MNYLTGYLDRTHCACTLQTSTCLYVKKIEETKPERIIISDESTFSTVSEFVVDGGFTAQ